jgi:hypothetical protein
MLKRRSNVENTQGLKNLSTIKSYAKFFPKRKSINQGTINKLNT